MDKCCEGKHWFVILGMIFAAFGIYFLVWGFSLVLSNVISWTIWNWNAILCFLIGIFLLGIGKMIKFKMMMHDMPMAPAKKGRK